MPEAKSSVLGLGISHFELGLFAVSILLPSVGASRVQEELHIKLCLGRIPAWLILPVPLGLSPVWGDLHPPFAGREQLSSLQEWLPTQGKIPCAQVEKHNFQTWLAR